MEESNEDKYRWHKLEGKVWVYDEAAYRVLKAYKRGTLDELWEEEKKYTPREISIGDDLDHLDDEQAGIAAATRIDGFAHREYRHLKKIPLSELDEEEVQLSSLLPGNLDELTLYLLELCGLDTWYDVGANVANFLAEKLAEIDDSYKNWTKREDEIGYLVTSERLSPLCGEYPRLYSRGILATSPLTFGALSSYLWEPVQDYLPGEVIHIVAIFHRKVMGHADYRFLRLGRIGVIEESGCCQELMERIIQDMLYPEEGNHALPEIKIL